MQVCGREIRVRGRLIRIAALDGDGYQFLEDTEATLAALRKSAARIDLFTFIQKLCEASPKYSYPMEWDNVAALHISSFDDWMMHQIDPRVRTKLRKAAKNGVTVREVSLDDALVRGIHGIFNESPIRQGKRFRYYGKSFEVVREMTATFLDQSVFIGAFFEGNLIGFTQIVIDETLTQAAAKHIISAIQHRDKAPTNALIAQAVRSCAERRIPYLWYGNFSYGKKRNDSLSDFKRHNGFQKVDLPRYYVPFTGAGRMALRLGLHHTLIDWIPEPLAATYRTIRKLWYRRRFSGVGNA